MERGEQRPLLDELWQRQYQDGREAYDGPRLQRKPFDWRAPAIVLGFEYLESVAYSGIALNLVIYLGTVLHGDNASNAATVDAWTGTTFLAPLVGAVIADSYWGKHKTIVISLIIYLLGMLIITSSAIIPSLRPAACQGGSCPPASMAQYLVFMSALYLVAIGTGGVKSALLPFGADQYEDDNPEEIVKKQSFFSWFFVAVNLGVLTSGSLIVWIQQNVDWALGFGIAASCLVLASVFFFLGTPIYRYQMPTGSPLKNVIKVLIASFRKMSLEVPTDSTQLYEVHNDKDSCYLEPHKLAHTDEFRCLDKAAVVTDSDQNYSDPQSSWRLCTVTQVEELKILVRMLPIWATGILYSAACTQMTTTFIQQGNAMNTKIGSFSIPAASLTSIEVIFMMAWVVIHDKVVNPIARRHLNNPLGLSQLQRMGVGRFLVILTMAAAALVELWRLESAKSGQSISIAWQVPQYVILAGSDVFCGIAQLEFFYGEAPDTMRSMCSAFSFLAISLGNYLNSFIITIVTLITRSGGRPGWIPADLNKGHLDYYFWLWTVISLLNFVLYLVFTKNYKLKKAIIP
ncbi:protein NRT1/ PTR FAMILY 8.3-like isoform X1 [Typha angustifolia]|uniref:protein NRT1/ PTR FAMILY 8.3-like isoform X1 n=1 Tax=Typha angustifolia TaxID=59011 RepID=UPI003C2F37EF